MKLSIKQYKVIIAVMSIVILAFLVVHFELDELAKASFEDGKERPWKLYDITYTESLNDYKAVGNARFYNDRLIDSVICERFDFEFIEIDGRPYEVLREYDVNIPYNTYYTIDFDLRNIPFDGIDVKLCAVGYDENGDIHIVPEELIIPLRPPVPIPALTPVETPVETSTPESTPGFEAVFAIAALLAVIHLIKKE